MVRRDTLRALCLVASFILYTNQAVGVQRGPGSRADMVQSAGLTFSQFDFSPTRVACIQESEDGECELFRSFEFTNPVLGLYYSRPGIQVFIGRGSQGANGNSTEGNIGDLVLLETTISVYGAARPVPGTEERDIQFIVPYGLHSGFRRLTSGGSGGSTDQFEATVIAVGLGAGIARVSGTTQFLIRAMPFFGLATRSLGFGNGTSTMLDGDAEIRFGPVKGSLGITIGYLFRWQKWNMEEGFSADQDFEGTQHGFRVGVFW